MLKNIERYLQNFRKDFKKLYEYEYNSTYGLDYLFNQLNEEDYYEPREVNPPGMQRRSNVSFRSHIGRDVADHAKASSRRLNWYVNETYLFEIFATSHWYVNKTNQFETS